MSSGQVKPTSTPSGSPAAALAVKCESAYLASQSAHAAAAIRRVIADLKADVLKSVDPRPLIKTHPWVMLASAVTLGFMATGLVVPTAERRTSRRLRAIERAMNRDAASKNENGSGRHKDVPSGGGIIALIVREAISLLKPVLLGMLASGFAGATTGAAASSPADSAPNSSPEAPSTGAQA